MASKLAFSAGLANPRMTGRTLYAAAKAATVAFTRTLAGELAGTAIRTQVVCPGTVATNFHAGMSRQMPSAMTPESVAAASLAGLELGETVCIPGLEVSSAALEALLEAETALLTGGNRPTPASRYGRLLAG